MVPAISEAKATIVLFSDRLDAELTGPRFR